MNTKLLVILALVALPVSGFTGLGAQARPFVCDNFNNRDTVNAMNDGADHLIAALRAKGINVGGIEDFGGCIRAYITDANGVQVMAYFDPSTLERLDVAPNSGL
ncbi:MAG TPA: hypothetical protein VGO70_02070 [Arsenicitalea sp.]|jgi:hypothetical protein|nr:hypothetical protein [Arsenicitalea sp.]